MRVPVFISMTIVTNGYRFAASSVGVLGFRILTEVSLGLDDLPLSRASALGDPSSPGVEPSLQPQSEHS